MAGFTVEVVKVTGRVHWAIKAVVDGVARYRGYYYKTDAITNLAEWETYHENAMKEDIFQAREFHHNFHSAEDLGITEVKV